MKLTLTLTFTSDWHIGSGSGRAGSVNKLVRRDTDGLPFVPARSLLGLWRDAAESLAQALEPSAQGWNKLVEALFGSQPIVDKKAAVRPIPGRIQLSPARISPQTLRAALSANGALREATTFIVPSVALDPATGAAEEDKLFFTELARVGATLTAEATVGDVDPAQTDAVRRFLAAAAEGIRAIGGKRRRGAGRCTVRVTEQPDATTAFFDTDLTPPTISPLSAPPVAAFGVGAATNNPPESWRITLTPLDPLLVHKRTLGNVVESLDRVPGTLLLGALAPALSAAGVNIPAAIDAGDLIVRDGLLRVDGARGAPVPRCLSHDKLDKTRVRSTLGPPLDQDQEKTFKAGFVHPVTPAMRVEVLHQILPQNGVEDECQRPTEAVGGVYAYQAIAPGQTFEAELWAAPALRGAAQRALANLNGQVLRVGRASRADYGRVRVALEEGTPAATPIADDRLVLWLRSPILLRDAALRPSVDPTLLIPALNTLLGTNLAFDAERSRYAADRVDSWQRSWGLARPSLVGIAAGSVLVFNGAQGATKLDALARAGLGERRAEGFGELIVNPDWLTNPPALHEPKEVAAADGPVALAVLRAEPYGEQILIEAARAAMRLAVAALDPPSAWVRTAEPAQLGALRAKVEGSPDAMAAASDWARQAPGRQRDANARPTRAVDVRKWLRDQLWDTENNTLKPDPWPPDCALPDWFDQALRDALREEAWRLTILRWCRELGRAQGRKRQEVDHGA